MHKNISTLLTVFISAFLFSIGLALSGMLDPVKVKSFLDITGHWDPSLMFVMIGAIGINIVLYHFILKRKSPVFAKEFLIPTKKDIDARLIIGAALFGIGWGMTGICPGPAFANILSGQKGIFIYLFGMFLGMGLFEIYNYYSTNLKKGSV